jgi:DNA-binding transcriptional LysR family regulator
MKKVTGSYDTNSSLELTPLRYLLAIAATGRLTTAARRMRVSQPAISVAMKKLEARLNTSLLLRSSKGVVLTPTGVELARQAEEVFSVLRRAEEQVHGLQQGEHGRFIVGCYHSFGAFFLPAMMKRLATEAPGLELSLWEGTADQVRDAVVDRTVHFGVMVSPRPHPELVMIKLFKDVMGVFVPGHLSPRERLEALARGPLFHVERVLISRKVVEALGQRGLLPNRVTACGDLELAKSLALQGAGAAVLPFRVATCNTPPGALVLADPSLPAEIDTAYLTFRADLHRTRAALRLKDALIARGAELHKTVELPTLSRRS